MAARTPGRYATAISEAQQAEMARLIAEEHLSLADAAELVGVHRQVAQAWERWGQNPAGKNGPRYAAFASAITRACAESKRRLSQAVANSAYPNGAPKADGAQFLLKTRHGYTERVEVITKAREDVVDALLEALREECDPATLDRVLARFDRLTSGVVQAAATGEPREPH